MVKIGGSGAEFGGRWECDITKPASPLIGKLSFEMPKKSN
jgi:hypothetical protein